MHDYVKSRFRLVDLIVRKARWKWVVMVNTYNPTRTDINRVVYICGITEGTQIPVFLEREVMIAMTVSCAGCGCDRKPEPPLTQV
jgi:hypothetical protein